MSIQSDIDEAKKLWNNSSLFTKILIGVSLFLTVSSVTSLADTIVSWRGFIADGLEFYRSWVIDPIHNGARRIGLSYTENEVDMIIVAAVYLTGIVRVTIRRWQVQGTSIGKKLFAGTAILSLVIAVLSPGLTDDPAIALSEGNFWALIFGYVIAGLVFTATLPKRIPTTVLYFGPGALALVVVLVLGAINAGLTA